MNLVFVTGGLAPGRDGIGDYCRVLAEAAAAAGARPALLALAEQDETAADERFAVLRLPAAMPWIERVARADAFLAAQKAERVLLQLSPYLYARRGLLGEAAPALVTLLGGRRPTVTVHETWVGELPFHRWQDRLIGPWQRRGYLAVLRGIAPARIVTSLPLYRAQLARHGVESSLLPLPGNVPVTRDVAALQLVPPVAGIFGGLWPSFDPKAALDALLAAAGGRATLLLIGRHGASAERLDAWRRRHPGLAIVETGALTPAAISQHLNLLHFAIAVSPWQLAGKSGTIAALLEHGVPVLTAWGDTGQASGVPEDRADLLHPPGSPIAPLIARQPGSGPFRPLAPAIAARLLQ